MSALTGLWERLEGKVGPRHRDRLAAVYPLPELRDVAAAQKAE